MGDTSAARQVGRCRRGAVLILLLVLLSGLSLLAFGLAHRSRLSLRMAGYQYERAYAREMAEAGLVMAAEQLERDANGIDHLGEGWHMAVEREAGHWFGRQAGPFTGSCVVRCSCIDEEGKLNLRVAGQQALETLLEDEREPLRALLDWQDEDDRARPGGAEQPYYNALPAPYSAKNAPVEMMPELLLLKGVTPRLYYGEDANQNRVLDANENDGNNHYPDDDADGRLMIGLRDLLTVHGDGRVNVNTASERVLAALPGLGERAAANIVSFRDGPDRTPGTDDDHPFETVEEMAVLVGLMEPEVGAVEAFCGFRSRHFRVLSDASVRDGAVRCEIEVILRREDGRAYPVLRRERWF